MKATEMLNKVKDLLGVELSEEVKLEQMKLENGTVLEAEAFEDLAVFRKLEIKHGFDIKV